MEHCKKPWQPIWLPAIFLALIGMSVFVYFAPPELQKGFLPRLPKKVVSTAPQVKVNLLNTASLSCSDVMPLLQSEYCTAFDIEIAKPNAVNFIVERIALETAETGMGFYVDPNSPLTSQSPDKNFRITSQVIGGGCSDTQCVTVYAFRALVQEGTTISRVSFILPGGNVVTRQRVYGVNLQ